MPTPETLADYVGDTGRLHMVISRDSSQHEQEIDRSLGSLVRVYGDRVHLIDIEEKAELTQEKIATSLIEGDALITAGGDGSDSLGVNTLLTYPGISQEVKRTPILSLPGGNANQGPRQLTPYRLFSPPTVLEVVEHGQIIESHPIHVSVTETTDDLQEEREQPLAYAVDLDDPVERFSDIDRLAVYFADIGIIGHTMTQLDEVRQRHKNTHPLTRGVRELPIALRGIQQSRHKPFSIVETVTQPAGQATTAHYDEAYLAVLIAGDRVAKYFRCPTDILEEDFYKLVVADISWPAFIRSAAIMRATGEEGEVVKNHAVVEIDFVALNPDETYWGQIDGQPFKLPHQGKITSRQHSEPYRAVTTRSLAEAA